MARKWRTLLVLPPSAIVITRAFSKDLFVRRSLGRMFLSRQMIIASAALAHSLIFDGDEAGVDDDPGSERPIDSIAVAMVFAVNIPPHAPAPGHACLSRSSMISSFVPLALPSGWHKVSYAYAPAASKQVETVTCLRSRLE
jgi:hypothetical protein